MGCVGEERMERLEAIETHMQVGRRVLTSVTKTPPEWEKALSGVTVSRDGARRRYGCGG